MSVDELHHHLNTSQNRLAASWEVFDLCMRAVDAMTWDEGVDHVQALVAADRCASGRQLLSAPGGATGVGPLPSPEVCEELLGHVRAVLDAAAREVVEPAQIVALHAAADHAAAAVIALRGICRKGT